MKNFFKTIRRSIYSPGFYLSLKDKPLKYSFKYFFALIISVALIVGLVFSIILVPSVISLGNQAVNLINEKYPYDLKITVKDGAAFTYPERTYRLKWPVDGVFNANEFFIFKSRVVTDSVLENIVVLNTQENFTGIRQFEDANTAVLLTRDSLVARGGRGDMRVYPLKSFAPDTVITKDYAQSFANKVVPFIKIAAPFLFAALVAVFFVFNNVVFLLLTLITAFLIWLAAKIWKKRQTYKKSYQEGLHALTLIFLADLLFLAFGDTHIPFFWSVAAVLAVWLLNRRIWEKMEMTVINGEPPVVSQS